MVSAMIYPSPHRGVGGCFDLEKSEPMGNCSTDGPPNLGQFWRLRIATRKIVATGCVVDTEEHWEPYLFGGTV
jgi:hypothetical protein